MANTLQPGDKFPLIQGRTVEDKMYNPSLHLGKKVFYSFFRYTGCPACKLYFNQVQSKKGDFEAKNIILVGLFEVELEVLKESFSSQGNNHWGTFIADPTGKFYDRCGLERSTLKLAIGTDKQAMEEGKKLPPQDLDKKKHMVDAGGKKNRMPAQFLVNEKGQVVESYYSKNITDRLPLNKILL